MIVVLSLLCLVRNSSHGLLQEFSCYANKRFHTQSWSLKCSSQKIDMWQDWKLLHPNYIFRIRFPCMDFVLKAERQKLFNNSGFFILCLALFQGLEILSVYII